jgi:hypothetical protein
MRATAKATPPQNIFHALGAIQNLSVGPVLQQPRYAQNLPGHVKQADRNRKGSIFLFCDGFT